jgi:hypothetical protein
MDTHSNDAGFGFFGLAFLGDTYSLRARVGSASKPPDGLFARPSPTPAAARRFNFGRAKDNGGEASGPRWSAPALGAKETATGFNWPKGDLR